MQKHQWSYQQGVQALIFGAGVLLAAQVGALPSLNAGGIQAGLWEVKTTQQVVDGQDVQAKMQAAQAQMAQALKNMPPAQRQQMEKMMGKGMGMGIGGAMQVCISPSMASMDKPLPTKDMECETLKSQRSSSSLDYEMRCKTASHIIQGKGKSTFTPTGMKTQADMQMQDTKTGQQHRMQTASEMRFVSKDCGAVKPLDEWAKELPVGAKNQAKR